MVKYEYKFVSLKEAREMASSEWRLVQVVGKTLVFEKSITTSELYPGTSTWAPSLNCVTNPGSNMPWTSNTILKKS
jgi:hypothetical protein